LKAATGGGPESMAVLLEAGANYNFVDSEDGVTPLTAVLASQGHVKGLNLILEHLQNDLLPENLKTYINLVSYLGGVSLMFAAAGGHSNATQLLIELGADVNAIARATPECLLKKLKKQIEAGTGTEDEPHVDGVTGVHVAAQGGHLEYVKLRTMIREHLIDLPGNDF
jgi:ankyrin repeat protein